MPDEHEPADNPEHLLEHLKDDSLAARLVRAHSTPDAGVNPIESMRTVLSERLEQVRESLDDREV